MVLLHLVAFVGTFHAVVALLALFHFLPVGIAIIFGELFSGVLQAGCLTKGSPQWCLMIDDDIAQQ